MHNLNTLLFSTRLARIRGLFRRNFIKTGGCWIWIGRSVSHEGYGRFGVTLEPGQPQQKYGAHRVAWVLANGAIPNGLYVLHRCDNPVCVNPNHLFLGTAKDNAADRDNKQRHRYVEPWVSDELRAAIRNSSESDCEMARRYKMSRTNVIWIRK